LVFTTANFVLLSDARINQLKYLMPGKFRKIDLSTGESAKSG